MNLQDLSERRGAGRRKRPIDPHMGDHLPPPANGSSVGGGLNRSTNGLGASTSGARGSGGSGAGPSSSVPLPPPYAPNPQLQSDGNMGGLIDNLRQMQSAHTHNTSLVRTTAADIANKDGDALDQLLQRFAACEGMGKRQANRPVPYIGGGNGAGGGSDFTGTMASTSQMVGQGSLSL